MVDREKLGNYLKILQELKGESEKLVSDINGGTEAEEIILDSDLDAHPVMHTLLKKFCTGSESHKMAVLIRQYNDIIDEINTECKDIIPKKLKLKKLYPFALYFTNILKKRSYTISMECKKLIHLLQPYFSEIDKETENRLDILRNEIPKLSDMDKYVDIKKNLETAIIECEARHFLSSAMITSRIIRYCIERINGRDINEKIKFLKNENLIKYKDEEAHILKANHISRNILSHDISKYVENPEDAVSLIGDGIKILKIIDGLEKCEEG